MLNTEEEEKKMLQRLSITRREKRKYQIHTLEI